MTAIPKRHVFFVKPIGAFRHEVWFRYEDGSEDSASLTSEWRAVWGIRFWLWINAARICADLQREHDVGWWTCEMSSEHVKLVKRI